jgi:hypothetical protein
MFAGEWPGREFALSAALYSAKQFSSLMFGPVVTGIPMPPLHPNVTQGMSETHDLPEPYCVKQNTKHSQYTNVNRSAT